MKSQKIKNAVNMPLAKPSRRKFLKILALGGGLFAMGNIVSRLENLDPRRSSSVADTQSARLRIAENKNEFIVYSKDGDELIVIDKDA